MTNTKFRKRALLSSVAMLLVALVALGSATFAWFVDDPKADAKGLTASAQSSTGLQIKTDSSTQFSHSAKIACATSTTGGAALDGIKLSPAMLNKKDGKFYSVKAAAASASAANTSEAWHEVTTRDHATGEGVYHEVITLRVTGTTSKTQTITLTGVDLGLVDNVGSITSDQGIENAVTVLIKDGSSTYYAYSKASHDVPAWNIDITDGTTTYTDASDTNKLTTTAAAASGLGNTFSIGAGTNQTKTLDLYVYLDGTHSKVYSDNAVGIGSIVTKCDLYFENTTP